VSPSRTPLFAVLITRDAAAQLEPCLARLASGITLARAGNHESSPNLSVALPMDEF